MREDLAARIRLDLAALAEVRMQMSPLIERASEREMPVIETAAACAMLHSFYTEVEKPQKPSSRITPCLLESFQPSLYSGSCRGGNGGIAR